MKTHDREAEPVPLPPESDDSGGSPPRGSRRRLPFHWLLVAPGLALLALIAWPFLRGAYWSLTDYRLGGDGADFVWFSNFVDLLTPGSEGYRAFWTTLQIAAMALTAQLVVGMSVAMLLMWPAWWTKVFRIVVVVPLLLPPVVAAIMWKVMMVDRGVLNHLAETLGFERINWLGDPEMALLSIVIIDTWLFTPFVVLIFLAGLQSVPEEVLEAAKVDGAGLFRTLWHIYLPLLRPFIVVVVVFRGIDSLKMFDVIWATTKGGPLQATENLHVLAYESGVNFLDYGEAMAALMVLWALSYVVSFVLLRRRRAAGSV